MFVVMRFLISLVLLMACLQAHSEQRLIHICTTDWPDYSTPDGKGLYFDIWRSVFEQQGYAVKVSFAPFKRCEDSVKRGEKKYDVYAAGWASDDVWVPEWHLGQDKLTVIYRRGQIEQWQGQHQLNNKRVAWTRGYGYDTSGDVTAKIDLQEVNDFAQGLGLLELQRIDFLIDYASSVKDALNKNAYPEYLDTAYDVIPSSKYFMAFRQAEKNKVLIKLWDEQMQKLHDDGTLKKLYRAINDPTY